jgi:hypothetical protein
MKSLHPRSAIPIVSSSGRLPAADAPDKEAVIAKCEARRGKAPALAASGIHRRLMEQWHSDRKLESQPPKNDST